jgi:hypothetical protein
MCVLFYFHPSHSLEKCTKAPFVIRFLYKITLVTDIKSRALAIRDSTGDRFFNIHVLDVFWGYEVMFCAKPLRILCQRPLSTRMYCRVGLSKSD